MPADAATTSTRTLASAERRRPADADSFDALDALLEAQAYRLSYWRVAVDEINYRRFFDVNDLAALRMNERDVFDSHARAHLRADRRRAPSTGCASIIPTACTIRSEYFERLQRRFGAGRGDREPLYVVTEKILAAHERLPETWLVHGTTGYDFAALVDDLAGLRRRARTRMTRRYRQFTENDASFDEIAYREQAAGDALRRSRRKSKCWRRSSIASRSSTGTRRTSPARRCARPSSRSDRVLSGVSDLYLASAASAMRIAASFTGRSSVARRRSAGAELSVFDFLRDVLLGEAARGRPAAHRQAMLEFAMKFQQVTAPVTAKGVEDTAFYRYNRLVCLNEVGGDPQRFATVRDGYASGESGARASLAARDARPPRRTTPSAARTCARASPC